MCPGPSAAGPEPNAVGIATCVCQTWRELGMGSSIHISVFPRSGAELGSMRPRRKQFESISFRLEMERVVDDAMDGDQVLN